MSVSTAIINSQPGLVAHGHKQEQPASHSSVRAANRGAEEHSLDLAVHVRAGLTDTVLRQLSRA
jgi:hypothetical protein